jgi:cobalamin biosynthesis protein CobW
MAPDALQKVEEIIAREARHGTSCLRSSPAGLAPELLLGLAAMAEGNMAGRESHHDLEGEEHDHDDFTSFVVASPTFKSMEELRGRVADALAQPGVLRIKGRAGIAGKSAAAVVQAVGPRIDTYFAAGDVGGIVVIGLRDIDREDVAGRLAG